MNQKQHSLINGLAPDPILRLNPWWGGQLPPFPQILPGHAHGPKKSSSIVQTYLQLWARPHVSVKSQNVFIDHCLKQSVVLFHDVTTSDVTSRLLQRKPWNTFSVVFPSHIVGFSPNLVYITFPPLHKCRESRKLIERFFGRFSRHVRFAALKGGVKYPHSIDLVEHVPEHKKSKFILDRLKD